MPLLSTTAKAREIPGGKRFDSDAEKQGGTTSDDQDNIRVCGSSREAFALDRRSDSFFYDLRIDIKYFVATVLFVVLSIRSRL